MKGFTIDHLRESEAGKRPDNQHLFGKPEQVEKKSKYGNKKVVFDGVTFASKKECNRYQTLKMLERAGEIQDLQLQVPFVLVEKQPGMRALKYLADFTYLKNGKLIVEDVKSSFTRKLRTYMDKKKLMKSVHGIDILET